MALLHSGKAMIREEVHVLAEKMLVGWEEEYAESAVQLVPWKMIVGQKL